MKPAKVGRRRLAILLCSLSAITYLILLAAVLLFYGTPYNPLWWWVMAAALVAAAVLPAILIRPIEWVISGYTEEDPP